MLCRLSMYGSPGRHLRSMNGALKAVASALIESRVWSHLRRERLGKIQLKNIRIGKMPCIDG